MTIKEKILKIMALTLEIEPTETRHITVSYYSHIKNLDLWVHGIDGPIEHIEYCVENESLFSTYDEIIKKLARLKDDMDAERQGET